MKTFTNPLLGYKEFVPYNEIKASDIVPAVQEAIKESKEKLEIILSTKENLSFENTLFALIELEEIIERVWTPVENLLSLIGTKEIRDAASEARPLVVDFFNEYSLDPRVYEFVKKYSQTDEAKNLKDEKARYLRNTLIDFKLSGAELEGEEKEQFKKLNLELSELSQKFSDNATDSKFELILRNENDFIGLPEDYINTSKAKAIEFRKELIEKGMDEKQAFEKIPENSGLVNLDYPSLSPFMKFSARGDLRKELFLAYLVQATSKATRGLLGTLEENQESLNNEEIIKKIFAAKTKQAQLLGFKNYAELSLETKMAPSPESVKEFLERLGVKAKPLAEKEYQELVKFQKEIKYQNSENNSDKVYPWDKEYLSEKLRKAKYEFDTNLLKPYFELYNTIHGMFGIAEKLFAIKFEKVSSIPAWHDEVEVYQIKNLDGSLVGTFYMDLFPRDTKRQGAWVMPLVPASINLQGEKIYPQCTLVCNLTKPSKDQASLLNHLEVTTLFHEFGHSLHHLLSQISLAPLSGTNVEWDFVELPSQLNENFVWEVESLKTFAKDYETDEAIPASLIEKLLASRTFNEGLACMRQIEFALFDLAIYMRTNPHDTQAVLDLYKDIVKKYGVFEVWEGTNFPCSFSHIFGGGYAAGYYSYKWAEVLEADAFSRFQNEGVLNSQVGKEYREAILERGDSESPMNLFKKFMGREPSEDALLKRMGL